MARYTSLVKDYLDNERRGIAELPEHPATLWKEIKDTQVIRFRGIGGVNLHSVYLTTTNKAMREEADLELSGRGTGRGRSSRGRGRGQGRGHGRGQGRGQGKGRERPATEPSTKYKPIKPTDIICWNCGKKGHRSSACPSKVVQFMDAIEEANVFLTIIQTFRPEDEDCIPDIPDDKKIVSVLMSRSMTYNNSVLMLDTQASIHLISNPDLLVDVTTSPNPITVQGITGDRIKVTSMGRIKTIGIDAYHDITVAANMLSYQKLLQTHSVLYRETDDTFVAPPLVLGPVIVLGCMSGHYILDLNTVVSTYFTSVNEKAAKYSKRQLISARKAYEFIVRMGFISYKSAAEVVPRCSIKDFGFTRSDLVNAQDIYDTPAAYQLGQGTQRKN